MGAVLDARRTESALLNKGFTKEESHHHYFVFIHEGKIVARTRMSHNGQEIGASLIAAMSRQCHLIKADFLDLARCPLSKERYIEKLISAGAIAPPQEAPAPK